jgi:hypothetical protein
MSASPDTESLADVLRQLVALAEDYPTEEAPSASQGDQSQGTEGKASDPEKVESAKPMSWMSP